MFKEIIFKDKKSKSSNSTNNKNNKQQDKFENQMKNLFDPYAPIKNYSNKVYKSLKISVIGGAILFLVTSIVFSAIDFIKIKNSKRIECQNGIELDYIGGQYSITVPALAIVSKATKCKKENNNDLVCFVKKSVHVQDMSYYAVFHEYATNYRIEKVLMSYGASKDMESECEQAGLGYDANYNACVKKIDPPVMCVAKKF